MGEVHLLNGGVVAVGVGDSWPRLTRVIDGDEIGGQGPALEGDLDGFDRGIAKRGTFKEDRRLLVEGVDQPRISRRAVEREIRWAVVVAGPLIALSRAGAVPARRAFVADG